jgi:hypothetical protein
MYAIEHNTVLTQATRHSEKRKSAVTTPLPHEAVTAGGPPLKLFPQEPVQQRR